MKIIIIEEPNDLMKILDSLKNEEKKVEPVKENHIQDFYKWTVFKKVKITGGEVFNDYLFSTEDTTTSMNIENIRNELNLKFPSSEYKVVELIKKCYGK